MKKQPKNSLVTAKASESKQPENKSEEFPGYPLYPANEDIMNRAQRIDMDLDSSVENNGKGVEQNQIKGVTSVETKKGSSDLTKDDFQALASEELQSTGDDEILKNRSWPVDFAADDLDIPGSEQDDAQEQIGSEDEENNSYSLGSDRHSDLEEDPT